MSDYESHGTVWFEIERERHRCNCDVGHWRPLNFFKVLATGKILFDKDWFELSNVWYGSASHYVCPGLPFTDTLQATLRGGTSRRRFS